MGNRTWNEWIAQYSQSHQNPVNRFCHTLGIPMIVVALLAIPWLLVEPRRWIWPTTLFATGWILQFIGHAFEGKPPEFFSDWRFLFVGFRWWLAKVSGRA